MSAVDRNGKTLQMGDPVQVELAWDPLLMMGGYHTTSSDWNTCIVPHGEPGYVVGVDVGSGIIKVHFKRLNAFGVYVDTFHSDKWLVQDNSRPPCMPAPFGQVTANSQSVTATPSPQYTLNTTPTYGKNPFIYEAKQEFIDVGGSKPKSNDVCACSMTQLMRDGCRCGAIQPYKPKGMS